MISIKKVMIVASLALSALLIFSCGDKSTGNPSPNVPEVEPFDKDTMAVRKILDTNGLAGVGVGEVITSAMVIDRETQAAVKRIGELKLQNRHITIIPQQIGLLTGLSILNLDSNEIGSIPQAIGKCTELSIIFLSNNNLTVLPPDIGNLDSLKTLILSHNALAALPAEIGSLHALERLQVDFNSLTALPSLSGLSKLKILWLNDNGITELPAGIETLNIQYLAVDNNKLCDMSPAVRNFLDLIAETGWEATQTCR